MFKNLLKQMNKALQKKLGYVVLVQTYEHTSWTFKDALAWTSCYPTKWGNVVISHRGKHVASRMGAM